MTVAILILIVNIMLSYYCYEKKSSVHSSKFLARVDLNLYFDLKNIYEAFKTVSEWGTLAFKMNRYVNWFQEGFYYFNHAHIYKRTDSRKL